MRVSAIGKLQHSLKNYGFLFYLFIILLITANIGVAIFFKVYTETKNTGLLLLVGIIAIISASQLAADLVNFFATLFVKPNLVPRMDYAAKIPTSSSTMVVIPTMLTTVAEVENLVEGVEVRFWLTEKTMYILRC